MDSVRKLFDTPSLIERRKQAITYVMNEQGWNGSLLDGVILIFPRFNIRDFTESLIFALT